jgi:hypothetical protein
MGLFPYQGEGDTGLGSDFRYGFIPEPVGNDGEPGYIPHLARRIVAFRFCQLKQITDTVGNGYFSF